MSASPAFLPADPALFNPASGRLGAARISCEMNLTVRTIAEAIGRKAPGVRSLQAGLRRVNRIWISVLDLYAGNKGSVRIFLNAPNRQLENRTPISFVERGEFAPLESFVDAMGMWQPS